VVVASRYFALSSWCVVGKRRGVNAAHTRQLDRRARAAIFGAEPGSVLTLTDALIRDTLPQESDGEDGRGIALQGGARGSVTRLVVSHPRETAVRAGDRDTSLVLEDVFLEGTAPEPDGRYDYGILAQDGASIDATSRL